MKTQATQHSIGFIRIVLLLIRREVVAKFVSPWVYAVATLVCLIAYLYGAGFQHSFETESILVTTDPLMALNMTVVIFVGLVLGLRLSTSVSWEREHRTLEVLLVGPVPWGAILVAKYVVELCILAAIVLFYMAYLAVGQPLGPGVIGIQDIRSIAVAPVFVLPVMAFGLLVSMWAQSVRSGVIAYLVCIGVLSVYEAVLGALTAIPVEDMNLSSTYLRAGLQATAPFIQPISPVAILSAMVERLFTQSPVTLAQISAVIVLTLAILALCRIVARLKGTSS